MALAEDLIGLKVLLLHPFKEQTVGGENFPSGNIRKMLYLHFAQLKFICTTSGLTLLTLTTLPRTDTSLSVMSPNDMPFIYFLIQVWGQKKNAYIKLNLPIYAAFRFFKVIIDSG
jgi:hypothetical protein